MSCPVFLCLALSCPVLSCLVLACLVLSCFVLACLVLSFPCSPCLVQSFIACHVLSWLALSCPVLSSPVFFRFLSWLVMSFSSPPMSCHVLPNVVFSWLFLSCPSCLVASFPSSSCLRLPDLGRPAMLLSSLILSGLALTLLVSPNIPEYAPRNGHLANSMG